MPKYKLLLIHPFNKDLLKVQSNSLKRGLSNYALFEPISLGILAALTNNNWSVKIVDEGLEDFPQKLESNSYDLVGITSDTSTIGRAIEISTICKNLNIKTVIGGIHASFNVEESLEFFDFVVVGEAEEVWPDLIDDFEAAQMKRVYEAKGKFNLKNAVIPDRKLFFQNYIFSVVYTSRGCPGRCSFCAVSNFFGRIQRRRPIDNIISELREIPQGRTVFFSDDDIIGRSPIEREKAVELFKSIIYDGINISWHAFTSIEAALFDEVLENAAKSGCRWLYIGFDSTSQQSLKEMNKAMKIIALKRSYNKLIKKINSYGILVYGGFIIGNDSDDIKSVKKMMRFIKYSYVNGFALFVLTPLPGTELFDRMTKEKRMLFNNFPDDWVHFNLSELTFTPKNMTVDEFNDLYINCHKYLNLKYIKYIKSILTLISTKSPALARQIYNFYKFRVSC